MEVVVSNDCLAFAVAKRAGRLLQRVIEAFAGFLHFEGLSSSSVLFKALTLE